MWCWRTIGTWIHCIKVVSVYLPNLPFSSLFMRACSVTSVVSNSLQLYGLYVACQALLFMGILQARILEWVAMPPPGDLPDPGIQASSLMSPALLGGFFTTSTTWEAQYTSSYAGLSLVSQLCSTLCDPMNCSTPGSSVHGDSLGKNTGAGCDALFQGIVPTQGSYPGLLHCR